MHHKISLSNFIFTTLIFAIALSSCTVPSKRLIKVWQYQGGNEGGDAPESIAFDAMNNALWVYADADSIYFRYDTAKDTLWLMNQRETTPYRIDQIKKKKLVLSSSIEGNFQRWYFIKGRELSDGEQFSFVDTVQSLYGQERKLIDLLPALHAPTVELRLKNLLLLFKEGDYITTNTIRHLVGIRRLGLVKETEEIAMQRYIINQFARITRRGNQFVATLYNGEVNAPLPIYTQEEGQRVLQTMLSLKIKKEANASFQTDYKSIRVDIDGVKIGKGWFLLGMPPLQIEGDWGELLGIRFYIAR